MMATYFHGGSEIQATTPGDHLQTLYLMNPNYLAAYSDNSSHNNNPHNQGMLFLNPSAGPNALISHPPQQQPCQQLIGIPLPGPHSENHGRPSSSTSLHPGRNPNDHTHQIPASLHGLAVSRVHYNLWSPTVDPSPSQTGPISTVAAPADVDGQMGFRRPPVAAGAQGLSLSLSPHQQNPAGPVTAMSGGGGDDGRMSVTVAAGGSSVASVSNGVQGVILGSKYLKAAQELLEEVVNVGDFNKGGNNHGSSGTHKEKEKAVFSTGDGGASGGAGEGSSSGSKKPVEQLTTAQRQELQMKKAKLLRMLDEVEQRYKQYHNQMQVVVSSFQQAAGIGSAKSYTSLALQTISRQFRCLKDAIASQIKSTSNSLGEEDHNASGSGVKLEGGVGSRLRFVDHQLRQQRALQQLGMMQHNAWRPQRGLPERAVSVLRAWLFEHFLHPYPKDSDKHMLAKQTGLTRSQVSNWFINARVRLWKPMVEEMYTEETKAQENLQNGGNTDETNTTTPNPTPTNIKHQSPSKTTITPHRHIQTPHHHQPDHHTTTNDMISAMSTTSSQGFSLIGSSSDMESLMGRSPKKQRSGSDIQENSPSSILSMDMEMKPPDNHHHPISNGSGFNPYLVHEMGRFNPDQLAHHYPGNGVSLTLGLPHCENLSISRNHQQNFMSQGMQLGRRLDIGAGEAEFCGISMGQQPSHPSNNGYDSIDIQSRTRFAAQLLHDFVA